MSDYSREELRRIHLEAMKGIQSHIRGQAVDQRMSNTHYPIRKGYPTPSRRLALDVSKWMREVEELLEMLNEELGSRD